jgi:ferricrocin synthase
MVISLTRIFSFLFKSVVMFPGTSSAEHEYLPNDIMNQLNKINIGSESECLVQVQLQTAEASSDSWNELELLIQHSLAELSKIPVERIKKETSIFQLGLDSINAVQIASNLRRSGLSVSTFDVIECPTLEKLAAKAASNKLLSEKANRNYDVDKFRNDARIPSSRIQNILASDAVQMILPCTYTQSAMLTEFVESKGRQYFNFWKYSIAEEIRAEHLRGVWATAIKHHDILRTGFCPVDHQHVAYAMIIYKYNNPKSQAVTYEEYDDKSFNLAKWRKACAGASLEALHQPPWRVAIVDDGDRGLIMHIAIHHALYDAYSINSILEDISLGIGGQRMKTRPPLKNVVATLLGESLANQDEAREFWEQRFSSVSVIPFPVMTPLFENTKELLIARKICRLSVMQVNNAIETGNYTMQVLIQAAWTRVLSAYLGSEEVVFGIVLSGRTTNETADAAFPCITTCPVASKNFKTNRDLISSMTELNSKLFKYQFVPLNRIRRWVGGDPQTRLFDTLLVYQHIPSKLQCSESESLRLIEDSAMIDYPVSMEIEPLSDGALQFTLSFNTDILPSQQGRLLLDQFDAIFCQLVSNPNGTEEDLWQTNSSLYSISPPRINAFPSEAAYLHELVERQAQSTPDKIALQVVQGVNNGVFETKTWTFAELNKLADQVASILRLKIRPGNIVATHFEKCAEAYISILGILKSGCAFVALDTSAPDKRNEFILNDSNAALLLTNDTSSLSFKVQREIVNITIDGLNTPGIDDVGKTEFETIDAITTSTASYCLYTSGTTGTPKGCEISHENAVQAMLAFQKLFDGRWDQTSKCLQFASFHFDVSVLEQYWSWSVGMTVVAAPRSIVLDDLVGIIQKLEITHIDLTPSLASLIKPTEVPSLCRGVFITGGEQLKQEILEVWGDQNVIHNAYGPTEATIGVTMYPGVPRNGRPSNIGRQFDNVGSYIFAPGTEIPVLRGGVGELCLSGKLVGTGYLNLPMLTNERFPTLKYFKERIYRTGDLVRILFDGCFEFLGRADDQVKLRGQRLEIGEINYTIRTGVSGITDVATIVSKHKTTEKDMLVSFVVTEHSTSGDKKTLELIQGQESESLYGHVRSACRQQLPGYMVPTYILRIPYIPLSPNNKVDTKALKEFFAGLSSESMVGMNVATARLKTSIKKVDMGLKDALAEFSGIKADQIVPSTSIFDLGIDSISVLRFARFLKQKGFNGLTPSLILRGAVVDDLVCSIRLGASDSEREATLEARQLIQAYDHQYRLLACKNLQITSGEIEYIAPCTALQSGMLARSLNSMEEGRTYFNTLRLKLSHDVDVNKLRASWKALVMDHAILRTAFVETPRGFAQVALRSDISVWQNRRIIGNESADECISAARALWIHRNQQWIRYPLEFLLLSSKNDQQLILFIFHGIYDGISIQKMLEWVSVDYLGKPRPVAQRFRDVLPFGPLRTHESSCSFWQTHLRGCSKKQLLNQDYSPSFDQVSAQMSLPLNLIESVRRITAVGIQSVLLAIWMSVLQEMYDPDVRTGVVISGRSIEGDAENVIGPLFNTLPFYLGKIEKHTWISLMQKCHRYSVDILPFQHVPLRDIQKWCMSGKPLFDNIFTVQIDDDLGPKDLDLWELVEDHAAVDYPLAFECVRDGNGQLRLSVVASGAAIPVAPPDILLSKFKERIEELSADSKKLTLPIHPIGLRRARPSLKLTESDELYEKPVKASADVAAEAVFYWTAQASAVRHEIAFLSGLRESAISEATSVLELGLDSVDLVKLSSRLRGTHKIDLSASQIGRARTIKSMIELLKKESPQPVNEKSHIEVAAINSIRLHEYINYDGFNKQDVEKLLPATPLQESMFASMIKSDYTKYFNHDVQELLPETDIERLKQAWIEVIRNSSILRTVFTPVMATRVPLSFCQVVLKYEALDIAKIVLHSTENIEQVQENSKEMARLGKGTAHLLRLVFTSVGTRTYLVLSIAHALYDGWSLAMMKSDVQDAYVNQLRVRPSADSVIERYFDNNDAKIFWGEYLKGVSPTLFPKRQRFSETDYPYVTSYNRKEIPSTIQLEQLSNFAKHHDISLHVIAQACWATILAQRARALDVVFGVVLAGRETETEQELMFPTINTVCLRTILHGTISGFLVYMQDNMLDIHDYQHYPLRLAQNTAGANSEGLFNSLFMLQRDYYSSRNDGTKAKSFSKSIMSSAEVEYPVCVELEISGNELTWTISCRDDYINSHELEYLLQQLDQTLSYIMQNPDQNILQFQGQHVAVCGLDPVIMLDGPKSHDSTATNVVDEAIDLRGWTEDERVIRDVLSQVSGINWQDIKRSHNLYHLGLDSITAIKAVLLLRNRGVTIGVRELVSAESIINMAEKTLKRSSALSPREKTLGASDGENIDTNSLLRISGINIDDVEDILPSLPMQAFMITVWQDTQGALFFPTFSYTVDGTLTMNLIKESWNNLLQHTPMLRTCLITTGSTNMPFLQVILKPSMKQVQETSGEYDEISGEYNISPNCGSPLVSLCVSKSLAGIEKWELKLRLHHALYDGFSLPIILNDFERLLNNLSPVSPKRQTEWKAFLQSHIANRNHANGREFWRSYLKSVGPTNIWRWLEGTTCAGRLSHIRRGAVDCVREYQELAMHQGVSLQALLFSAAARAVANLSATVTGKATVVFGVYLANRIDIMLDSSSYPLLNILPLKVEIPDGTTPLTNIAATVQKELLKITAMPQAMSDLWEIYRETDVALDLFVNFLSQPDILNERDENLGIKLRNIAHSEENATWAGQELRDQGRINSPRLTPNPLRGVFPVRHIPRYPPAV